MGKRYNRGDIFYTKKKKKKKKKTIQYSGMGLRIEKKNSNKFFFFLKNSVSTNQGPTNNR